MASITGTDTKGWYAATMSMPRVRVRVRDECESGQSEDDENLLRRMATRHTKAALRLELRLVMAMGH